MLSFFFFKQKTAYEIRPCDWSSDVCSSDLWGIRVRHERERKSGGVSRAERERRDLVRSRRFGAEHSDARADGQRGRLQTPRALDVGVIPPPVLRADHHERLGGQRGGPFQDPLNEARIARGGVGEGSEREREARDDEPPSRGNQCRTTSEHDSPTKKTPSREFHRPLPGRSVLELGARSPSVGARNIGRVVTPLTPLAAGAGIVPLRGLSGPPPRGA